MQAGMACADLAGQSLQLLPLPGARPAEAATTKVLIDKGCMIESAWHLYETGFTCCGQAFMPRCHGVGVVVASSVHTNGCVVCIAEKGRRVRSTVLLNCTCICADTSKTALVYLTATVCWIIFTATVVC